MQVHGLKRRSSSYNHPRLEHILDSSELKWIHTPYRLLPMVRLDRNLNPMCPLHMLVQSKLTCYVALVQQNMAIWRTSFHITDTNVKIDYDTMLHKQHPNRSL